MRKKSSGGHPLASPGWWKGAGPDLRENHFRVRASQGPEGAPFSMQPDRILAVRSKAATSAAKKGGTTLRRPLISTRWSGGAFFVGFQIF